MNDPYRKPGEKESEPLPKKPAVIVPMIKNIWNWLGDSILFQVVFWSIIALTAIVIFAVKMAACDVAQREEREAATKQRYVDSVKNTCVARAREHTDKFEVVSYNEVGESKVEEMFESRAEAEDFMASLPNCTQ